MSRLRIYVTVLASVAVVGVGWIGWEEHRLLEQSTTQNCLVRAQAQNDVTIGALALIGTGGDSGGRAKIFTSVSDDAIARIKACG